MTNKEDALNGDHTVYMSDWLVLERLNKITISNFPMTMQYGMTN